MATWTHFTSYLDGSRQITKAERNELLDNFKAALEACCSAKYTVNSTKLTAVKASDLITDLVEVNGPASLSGYLSAAIVFAGSVFSPSGSSVLATAATNEGLTSGQYDDLFNASLFRNRKTVVDDYRIWNILKRAIDLLACAAVPAITSSLLVGATACSAFTYTITASNGATLFGYTGGPAGLTFNADTGVISGTPISAGTYDVTIQAANGCGVGSATLRIVVAAASCPSPSASYRIASASKTKCGFAEFGGYESTPPKFYLVKSATGSVTITDYDSGGSCSHCVEYQSYTLSGSCSYDRATCDLTEGINLNFQQSNEGCTFLDLDTNETGCGLAFNPFDNAISYTSTTAVYSGAGTCTANRRQVGSITETLSSEFTTAMLSDDVDTALAAAAFGSWTGGLSGTAFYDLTSDEATATKQKLEYKFTLPSLSGWSAYSINWIERFTPDAGGGPTDTAKSYVWDGSATETPVYSVAAPTTPGDVTIVSVTTSCSC